MSFGQWLGFLSFLLALYILWQIKQLLLLLFTAVILATALNRLVKKIQSFGIRRQLAVVLTLSLLSLLVALFFSLIVPPFSDQFQELVELLPEGLQRIHTQVKGLEQQYLDRLPFLPSWSELISKLQITGIFDNFFSFFSNSFTVLWHLILVFVLTLMLLANPGKYRDSLLFLFPSFYRRRADEILSECELALGNWLGGITINCIFIGTFAFIGLSVLQLRLVLAHALLAGLLNFIPNIGPVTSVIFPFMIALLDAPWKLVPILIWYVIIQNIETYWLSPTVMAKQVSLLPAVTLSAQVFCAMSFGLLGLILALPLTVVAKTWMEELLFKDILDRWN